MFPQWTGELQGALGRRQSAAGANKQRIVESAAQASEHAARRRLRQTESVRGAGDVLFFQQDIQRD
jgi:hypothetical protein